MTRKSPPPSFEQALSELETLVTKMEQGELSLEESLKSFERGVELTGFCERTLTQAEQRVRILSGGTPAAEPEPFQGAS